MYSLRYFLLLCWFVVIACQHDHSLIYVCPPCDQPCDTIVFNKPGVCPHCHMDLIPLEELQRMSAIPVDSIYWKVGSGEFRISGGGNHADDVIRVFYHLPENYKNNSPVLLVIPGAGRNGDSYRDAWVEESEKYGVIVVSPMYKEENYPFEAYHLGGTISNSNFLNHIQLSEGSNQVLLDEENLSFDLNTDSGKWIFQDFDRLFDLVKETLELETKFYDVFGHSAGGQILHRHVILNPSDKANRIIAANSGFYTLPDLEKIMPFGIKGLDIDKHGLQRSFSSELTILCGALDNETETRGTMLRSVSADLQGEGRLARGKYFYEYAKDMAMEYDMSFNWRLMVVPNVGHDHRRMGDAVAAALYE